jgi:hypothetical protein
MHKRALPGTADTITRRIGERYLRSLPGSPQLGLVLFCLVSVLGLNLAFVVNNPGLLWLVPAALPLLAPLAAGLFCFCGWLWNLQNRLVGSAGRLPAAFVLFLLFFLGVVILYYLLLALPLGLALKVFSGPAPAVDYRRWSLDLAAAHSLIFLGWTLFRRH